MSSQSMWPAILSPYERVIGASLSQTGHESSLENSPLLVRFHRVPIPADGVAPSASALRTAVADHTSDTNAGAPRPKYSGATTALKPLITPASGRPSNLANALAREPTCSARAHTETRHAAWFATPHSLR